MRSDDSLLLTPEYAGVPVSGVTLDYFGVQRAPERPIIGPTAR